MHFALLAPIYYTFLFLSLFLPGYVLVKRSGLFAGKPGLELILGYAITLSLYALLATCSYALRVSPLFTAGLSWLALAVAAIVGIRSNYHRDLWQLRFPLLCLAVMALASLAFLALPFSGRYQIVPDPQPVASSHYNTLNVKVLNLAHTQANDNYVPYRQAQFFLNRSDPAKDSFIAEWGVTFFVRTPLMGAVTANYLNMLHEHTPIGYVWNGDARDPQRTYLQFQILAALLNNLFIIPAFYLLQYYFKKKTALISCLFLVASSFFLYNTIFSWPKSLAAFFILSAWCLLLITPSRRGTIAAGLLCGLAYLTHDLAILYIGATVIYLAYRRRFADVVWVVGLPLVCAVTWLVIAKSYHQPSSFVYYPLSTTGIPPVDGRGVVQQFLHTNPLRIIAIRPFNLVYLLTPFQLFTSEGGQALPMRLWALGIYSIPGAIGVGLLPAILLALWKRLVNWGFLILSTVPVVCEALFIGWPKGLGALHFAEAVVVMGTGLGVYYLVRMRNRVWLMAAYCLACLQYGFLVVYSYHYAAGAWLGSLRGLAAVVFLAGVLVGAGWLVYQIDRGRKIQLLYN